MNIESLPDSDHVSRLCKPSSIDKESGLPDIAAFLPRRGEEYLSVNWLEHFKKLELSDSVDSIREVFKHKNYTLRPTARFVVLNVGETKSLVLDVHQRILRIEQVPLEDDRSHSGIFGYSSDDLAIAAEIAALVTDRKSVV